MLVGIVVWPFLGVRFNAIIRVKRWRNKKVLSSGGEMLMLSLTGGYFVRLSVVFYNIWATKSEQFDIYFLKNYKNFTVGIFLK